MKRKRSCACCKKSKPLIARELCSSCYAAANRAVRAKETTWQGLEADGLAGPRRSSVLRKALSKTK